MKHYTSLPENLGRPPCFLSSSAASLGSNGPDSAPASADNGNVSANSFLGTRGLIDVTDLDTIGALNHISISEKEAR
jgi:hypothetical protein